MRKFGLVFALLALVPSVVDAQARRPRVDLHERATEWAPVAQSMTELLDAGWKIVAFNNYQTEMFEQNENSFSFILQNGSKYIICMLDNPSINDTNSKCRALN